MYIFDDKARKKFAALTRVMTWGGQLQSKKRQIVAFCRLFVAFLGGDKKLQRDF